MRWSRLHFGGTQDELLLQPIQILHERIRQLLIKPNDEPQSRSVSMLRVQTARTLAAVAAVGIEALVLRHLR